MVCNDLIIFVAIWIICKYAKTCILLKNFWTLNVMMAQNLPANWEMCRKFSSPYNLSYPRPNSVPIIASGSSSLLSPLSPLDLRSSASAHLDRVHFHHLLIIQHLWFVFGPLSFVFLYIVSCIQRSCDHHK